MLFCAADEKNVYEILKKQNGEAFASNKYAGGFYMPESITDKDGFISQEKVLAKVKRDKQKQLCNVCR